MFTGISFAYFGGKRKEAKERTGLNAEGAEVGAQRTLRRVKRGGFVASDRKSPRIANRAKRGAPSSSFG